MGNAQVFGNVVIEAYQLAFGRDIDAELFLLLRAEPAERPAPQPHPAAHQLVGALQTQLAFEEGFAGIVVVEAGGFPVSGGVEAQGGQDLAGQRGGLVATHPEIDGGLRKGAVEVAGGIPHAARQQDGADEQKAVVLAAQLVEHPSAGVHQADSRLAAQCSPMPPRM